MGNNRYPNFCCSVGKGHPSFLTALFCFTICVQDCETELFSICAIPSTPSMLFPKHRGIPDTSTELSPSF